MTGNPTKLAALFALLLGVWVVTYWLWEPRVDASSAPISFAAAVVGGDGAAPTTDRPADPVRPGGAGAGGAAVSEASGPGPNPGPRRVFVPPRFREYTVQAGDRGFDVIARRVYGDAKLADAVAAANPLVSPSKLVPGRTKLRIAEDPTNIQGKTIEVWPSLVSGQPGGSGDAQRPRPTRPTEPAPSRAEPPAPAAPVTEHVVAERETLSHIAQRYYGKSAMWKVIYDANRDQLDRPERVRAGMRLRIPAAP